VQIGTLRELARLYNLQLSYEDASGKRRDASREALEAVLKTRLPAGADFREALRARKDELQARIVEPVVVVWGRSRPRIPVRHAQSVEWEIQLEDGTARGGRSEAGDGVLVLDHALPTGYHKLRLMNTAEALLICAPMTAPAPTRRSWGIFMPLYAAYTAHTQGIGDLADLQGYRSWVNDLGGGVVATLPLLANFEDEPSPYSPVSRLFWNEMYLDPTGVPEFDPADFADRPVVTVVPRQIDYAAAYAAKRKMLEKMAARFQRDEEFERFARQGAYGYAHFRAAKEDRDSAGYHLYVQHRMEQQMRQVAADARRGGVGLYLDFPLGVHPGGFDAWKYANVFAHGVSVGAPPDLFFTKGQNWGFPPLDPDAIRALGYRYFRDCIRHHTSHAGILRIDHVMGLHRLFWIPDGMEPKDGVYVRYREDEFYAALIVEAHRSGCAVVGEDLGTVPQYVPQMMSKHGLRRMHVVQYEIQPDQKQPINIPPRQSVASINTHDMPTFAGFWSGKDIDERMAQVLLDDRAARKELKTREEMRQALAAFLKARGLLLGPDGDTKEVLEALLMFLGGSPAEIVLVNLEDLWLEEEPQNVPGVPERSWKQRFRYSLEEVRANRELERILRRIDQRRREVDGNEAEET
jgi:4-alpha-glucanotransferase